MPFSVQRKRPKRKGTSHLSANGGFPVLLESAGSLKTRFAQTVQTPFSAVSAVLGCMTMVNLKHPGPGKSSDNPGFPFI